MALYVNGEKVDEKDIQAEAEKMRPRYEQVFSDMEEADREKQLAEWARENVIESVLMRQAAVRDIEEVPSEIVDGHFERLVAQAGGKSEFFNQTGLSPEKEDEVKEDISAQIRLEQLVRHIAESADRPGEKEVEKHYEQNIEKYTIPEMIRAAHIVKHPAPAIDLEESRDQMESALAQLQTGSEFAEMAAQYSDCPENGGDLGYFARGQMVKEFDDVVFSLQPGELSEVFSTEFGLHIAKVTERKPAMPCPLEDVREAIEKELTEQNQAKALEKFVDAEKEKATIEDK